VQKSASESAKVVANPILAANMARLMAGRGILTVRDEMGEKGISIGAGTLQRALRGEAGNRLGSLQKIAAFFRVEVDRLLTTNLGDDNSTEFVDVPKKEVSLSAGSGNDAHVEETVGRLKFRADFLRSVGASPAFSSVVDVDGRSMEPTVPDGAVVLISTANREPRDRLIYALRIGRNLFVKRLVRADGRWIARSDNEDRQEYPDIDLEKEADVEIIGRAVWMGAKL
jgi:phage repressor protein C with HTH and peptisase S24 domain